MALDLTGIGSNQLSLDGKGSLRFNYASGELQESTYLAWTYQSGSGTNFTWGTRRETSSYRDMRRVGATGNRTDALQAGGTSPGTTAVHDLEGTWFLVMARWVSASERSLHIFGRDGSVTEDFDTTSTTNSNTQSDLVFYSSANTTYLSEVTVCNKALPAEVGRQIAMGASPLSFLEVRDSLIIYEPLESRYGEWSGPSLPIETGSTFSYTSGRPRSNYIPAPRFVPAILTAASGVTGTGTLTDAGETITGVGSTSVVGTGTLTEGAETVAGTGAVNITGTGTLTDGGETLAATGAVNVTGTGTLTEGAETVAGTGSTTGVITGTGALTDGGETFAATGTVVVSGTGALVEGGETITGVGSLLVSGTGALTEGAETVAGVGVVFITGTGALADGGETISGTNVVASNTYATGTATVLSATGTTSILSATGTVTINPLS